MREVAAEACVRILQSGLVSKTPQTIAPMAAATGVPVDLMRQTWAMDGRRRSPLGAEPVKEGDELPPTSVEGAFVAADRRLTGWRRGTRCRRGSSG